MTFKNSLWACCTALFTSALPASAQHTAIKTNLVSDACLSPGLGIELGLAPKWTLDISGQVNFWNIDSHRWKHWMAQPEIRYWFCRRFGGHFLGLHVMGGEYNIGNIDIPVKFLGTDFGDLKDRRYEGWGAGAGIGYGYAWPVGKHWNIEAEIGVGWVYTRFNSYPCAVCGTKIDNDKPHNYFGPTKLAINVEYLF